MRLQELSTYDLKKRLNVMSKFETLDAACKRIENELRRRKQLQTNHI